MSTFHPPKDKSKAKELCVSPQHAPMPLQSSHMKGRTQSLSRRRLLPPLRSQEWGHPHLTEVPRYMCGMEL